MTDKEYFVRGCTALLDAVEAADRFGIGADRAANYHADSEGTQLNYDVVSEIRETMGCEKPVVVTRVGGLSSFAKGKIVEPKDDIGLANAILEIPDMDNLSYDILCNEAYKAALNYSWKKIVDIHMQYYPRMADLNNQKTYSCKIDKLNSQFFV